MKNSKFLGLILSLLVARIHLFEIDIESRGDEVGVGGIFYLPFHGSDSYGNDTNERKPYVNFLVYKIGFELDRRDLSVIRLKGSFIKFGYTISDNKREVSKKSDYAKRYSKSREDFIFESVQEENVFSSYFDLETGCFYFSLFIDKAFTRNRGNIVSFCFGNDFREFIISGKSDRFSRLDLNDVNGNYLHSINRNLSILENEKVFPLNSSFSESKEKILIEEQNSNCFLKRKSQKRNNELNDCFNSGFDEKDSFRSGYSNDYKYDSHRNDYLYKKKKELVKISKTINIGLKGRIFSMKAKFFILRGHHAKFYIPHPVSPLFPSYRQIEKFINNGFKGLIMGKFNDFSFNAEEFVKVGNFNKAAEFEGVSFIGTFISSFNISSSKLLNSEEAKESEFILSRKSKLLSGDVELYGRSDSDEVDGKKDWKLDLRRVEAAKEILPEIESWRENEIFNFKFLFESKSEFVSTRGYCDDYGFSYEKGKNCFRVLGNESDGYCFNDIGYSGLMNKDKIEIDEDEKCRDYTTFGINVKEIGFVRLYDEIYADVFF